MILFLLVVVLIIASIILTYSHVKTLSIKIDALTLRVETLQKQLEEKSVN